MATSKQLYANNAKSTLSAIISSSDTTIAVYDGSLFPSPGTGEYFLITLESGGVIEIIKVQGKSGNSLTGCVRGQEGTVPSGFQSGTRVECRVTSGTLDSFARKIDRVVEINGVDNLDPPTQSNSNSYICSTIDDSGNPIVAFKNTSNGNLWRFVTHSLVIVSGSATSATTTSLNSTSIASLVANMQPGKYIIQFLTGANVGRCRAINSASANTVAWSTPLPATPTAGDQFEIYKSDSSNLKELIVASGTVISDASKADVNNANLIGTTSIAQAKITNMIDVKATLTANTATTTLDLSTASVFKVTIAASTSFVFSNVPTGSNVFSFTLMTINDATGGRAVSFPSGKMQWAGGLPPPRTTTANAVDVWTFFTDDAGTTWKGSLAIADVKS